MDAQSPVGAAPQSAPEKLPRLGLLTGALVYHPFLFIFFVLAAAGAGAAVWYFFPPPRAFAYAVFQIRAQADLIAQHAGDANADFAMYKESQSALIKGRLVLNSALSQPEVNNLDLLRKQPSPIDWLEEQLKTDFKMSPELMRLSIEGDNETELKAIIAAITDSYLKDVVNRDKARKLAHLERLTKIHRKLEDTLANHRKRIRDLASALGVSTPESIAVKEKYIQEEISAYRKEIIEIERQLARAKTDAVIYEQIHIDIPLNLKEGDFTPAELDAALASDPVYTKLLEKERTLVTGLEKDGDLSQVRENIKKYAETFGPPAVRARNAVVLKQRQQEVKELKELHTRIEMLTAYRKTLGERLESLDAESKSLKLNQSDFDTVKAEIAETEKMADRILKDIEALKPELDLPSRVSLWEEASVVRPRNDRDRLRYAVAAGISVLVFGYFSMIAAESRLYRRERRQAELRSKEATRVTA